MMRRLLSLWCLLFATVSIYAGDDIVLLKDGNLVVFKQKEQALVELDFSKTMVKDQTLVDYLKGRGEDFVADWPKDQDRALEFFTYRFNKKNKDGLQVSKDAKDAKYKMIIHVDWMDMGNGASGFMPWSSSKAGGVILKGTMDIIDQKVEKYVCRLSFDEIKGNGNPSETARLGGAFFVLATKIFKQAKNATGSVEYCGDVEKPKKKVVKKVVEEEVTAPAKTVSAAKKTTASRGKGTAARRGTVRKGTGNRRGTSTATRKGTSTAKPAAQATTAQANKPRKVKYIEVDEDGNEVEVIYVKKGTKTPVEKPESEERPVVASKPQRKAPAYKGDPNKVPQTVLNAVSNLKIKESVGGDASCLKGESQFSVYLDFSKCDINHNNEHDFVKYMATSVDEDEREANFARNWENKYKPSLTAVFTSEMNKQLAKECSLRGTTKQGCRYTLRVALKSIDDNGNTVGDYLIVETATGKVVHIMQMRSKGGHFGDYMGLLKQGFEGAGKVYGELLADRID